MWLGSGGDRVVGYNSRGGAYAETPEVSSATDGSCCGGKRRAPDSLRIRGMVVLPRRDFGDGSGGVVLERENGTTPALRAISCSPSCQCIASAARHGIAISSAILAHISGLNLFAG